MSYQRGSKSNKGPCRRVSAGQWCGLVVAFALIVLVGAISQESLALLLESPKGKATAVRPSSALRGGSEGEEEGGEGEEEEEEEEEDEEGVDGDVATDTASAGKKQTEQQKQPQQQQQQQQQQLPPPHLVYAGGSTEAVHGTGLLQQEQRRQPQSERPQEGATAAAVATTAAPAAAAASGGSGEEAVWIFCCGQWQDCLCAGRVRWGNKDKWKIVDPKPGEKEQQVKCNIDKLGDPFPGDDGKHCQCEVTPGTPFFNSVNPGLLSSTTAKLVTSCDQFKEGANDGDVGAVQWEAMEAFCSPTWPETEAGSKAKAGPRAFSVELMQSLMRSWVDNRFVDVHSRYFGESGWVNRAFVNYYAGPPTGKHAAMTEQLIRSVHEFSKEPIIVFHFGVATPEWWTKAKYPRLVLLHSSPMPANAGRSFNFNKMRAMLLSKAKVGIQLDSDQFVAPGVDAMFKVTEREITKDYAMPILPAHFLDRTPRDTGKYWERFCPKDKCKWQTARWGHAHPTWTYWALPWLSRWLRRNFRDETLPVREGGSMAALRIIDVPEDEDLLNVGTWEERGTKQWCKLDLPGPGDFSALLRAKDSKDDGSPCTDGACGDIGGDRRYHPHGVAKVFYTAHHAVDPSETKRYIKALKEKLQEGKLPPPILFNGRFYRDGDHLRAAHPDVTCII
mmetsp:Transcript_30171/g.79577  ORF Transcript_30171/g.79577 Transcript_30171/m.79577 type:complete len:673 (-) Transcript_30171:37-2055(-)